jgi:hypothetical protein
MSSQPFTATQREAIWLAYDRKCAYTKQLLDVSNFHIDHILPESLADDPQELSKTLLKLGLPADFDLYDYANLAPCQPSANLQKAALVLDPAHVHFFLGIAAAKKPAIEENLARIERRKNRGRAIILLQQALERGELSPEEVADILQKHTDQPEGIFELLEGLQFADSTEIRLVARSELEALRDRPIRLGQNDHIEGVTLTGPEDQERLVRTCREYDAAIKEGFYAYSNFDMKMSTWFEHQCGLIRALQAAASPTKSFIENPRVGIHDLNLVPFSFFPIFGEPDSVEDVESTYQSKVDDGTLVVKRLRHNLLQIQEPEGMGQQLIEVARADFDGDGVEDILLFEYCYATHGTMGFGGIRIVTRKSNDGKFSMVTRVDA